MTINSEEPIYPKVTVQLIGLDGNTIAIVNRVSKQMRLSGIKRNKIIEFQEEALSGDYNHVIQTCMKYVNVE